jgi:hypothetical protein
MYWAADGQLWWRTVASNLIEPLEVSFTADSRRSQVGQNMGNWDLARTGLDHHGSADPRLRQDQVVAAVPADSKTLCLKHFDQGLIGDRYDLSARHSATLQSTVRRRPAVSEASCPLSW